MRISRCKRGRRSQVFHLAVSARGSADVERNIRKQNLTPRFSEGAGNLMDYPDPPRAGPEQSRR
jgi:hypothetical protein